MKDKKGMMVFNWILIILVGAVIIIFGVIFATKVGVVEQQKNNVVVAEYMDLLFNPFASIGAITEGFGKKVNLPYEINAEFVCVSGKEKLFIGTGTKRADENLENFVYSSSKLKSKELFISSKPFNLPFRVTDLIFISDYNKEFCLLYDPASEGVVDEIISELSDNYENDNFLKCRDLNCCQDAKVISFQRGVVADVVIADGSGNFEYGEVIFPDGSVPFIGLSMIEAAIFSDHEIYSCNFERLMGKISDITRIYDGKASFLGKVKQGRACNYGSLRKSLKDLDEAAQRSSASLLYLSSQELSDQNRRFSCAQIY